MSDPSALDPTSLVQFGALGVVLLLFVLGRIYSRDTVEALRARVTQLEADNKRLTDAFTEKVIPALERSTLQVERLTTRRRA